MKLNSIAALVLILLGAMMLACANAPSQLVTTNQVSPSGSPEIPFVAFCDLVRNPSSYDQKIIRTKAIYSVGKDTRTLWDETCDNRDSYIDGECFHPPEKTCEKISEALDNFRGGEKGRWLGGHTLIEVVGQFYANPEAGNRHRLELLEIKDAKPMDAVRHRS